MKSGASSGRRAASSEQGETSSEQGETSSEQGETSSEQRETNSGQRETNSGQREASWGRRAARWIPILTLVAVLIGYLARDTLAPAREELVIEPPPAAQIPPLELPERAHSLAGRVVDLENQGVASALVWLRAGDEPHWTYTGEDGSFRLEDLEAGPWNATVVAVGFAPHAQVIEEGAETAGPLTIRLEKPFGPLPTLPPIARAPLAGTVTSRLPGALAGCEVVLIPTLPPQVLSAPLPRRADIAADGSFAIQDLITGEYRVEVRPEWARGGSWPDLARALDGSKEGNGSNDTGASNSDGLQLFTHATPTAAGTTSRLDVELATGDVVGKFVDLDFQSVEGALLLLAQASDPNRVWPTVESGPDGSFALRGLPAGRYSLTARAGSATLVQEIVVRAGETSTLDVAPLEVRRAR